MYYKGQRIVVELTHKRGWDSKVFDTGKVFVDKDNKELPIYGTKLQNGLHDIETDGSFVDVINRFRPYVGNVSTDEVIRNRGKVKISDTGSESKDRVKVTTKRDCGVSLKLKGYRTYGPHFDTLKDTYYTTDNGITLRYYPNYKGVNIVIEVANPATALNVFRFTLKEYGCSYTYEKIEGGIKCISSTGQDDLYIKALYVKDANDDYGTVDIDLDGVEDGRQIIKKTIAPVWLGNAVGPVELDPSVTIEDGVAGGVIEDAVMAGGTTLNYGARVNMNCNDFTGGNYQNWWINVDLSGEDSSRTVTLAKFINYCDYVFGGGGFECSLWPSLRQAVEGTKDGVSEVGSICGLAARYTIENWTTINGQSAGNDYDDTLATATFTAPTATGSYDIVCANSIIQARLGSSYFGDIIHSTTRTASKSFRTQTSEGANKPQFYYEYTEGGFNGFPIFFQEEC